MKNKTKYNAKYMETARIILNEYYPEYVKDSPLPPDLLLMCINMNVKTVEHHHPNGKLVAREHYYNGKRYGLYERWQQNGSKKYEINYIDGDKHGECIFWHNNGKKALTSTWYYGLKHGTEESWYSNGVRESIVEYDMGWRCGKSYVWEEDGSLRISMDWEKNDIKFGMY